VTNFARSLAPRASSTPLRLSSAVLAGLLAALALLAIAPRARAEVVSIGAVPVGMQPRVGAEGETEPTTYANPSGNPVLHSENTYAIYWDPTDHYHGDWQNVIDGYLANVGLSSGELGNVFDVLSQYTDKTNVPARFLDAFHGAYTDTAAYPASGCVDPAPFQEKDLIGPGKTPVCLTSGQVAAQLEAFIAAHNLPKGMGTVYYVLTPPAVAVCLDGGGASGHCSSLSKTAETYENSFCSYHAAINPGGLPTGDGNTILYGVIPWTAGGIADPHLTIADQQPGVECQDGGFDPSTDPPGKLEEAHERNTAEQEAFEKMNKAEKEEVEERESYEGPHEEQPNQQPCPTTDGGCDRGLADPIINQLGLEQMNIVTNPLLNAWQDERKAENTDECRFDFAAVRGGSSSVLPGSHAGTLFNQEFAEGVYYINDVFNLAALRLSYPGIPCVTGVNLDPKFTSPNHVNAGEVVSFNGMESQITLNASVNYPGGGAPAANYATYSWDFGDGTSTSGYAPGAPVCEAPWLSPCAASAFHTYTYGGTYLVTLTVSDVGGNVDHVTQFVQVNGPAAPGSAGGASGGAATPGGAGSAPGSGAGSHAAKPVATAAVVSRSLRTALRKGLAIGYSVNEQVTGHFEVLLSRATAHKLKIGGAPAIGLPAGSPAEIVIAKAILVTTKGGHSVVHVKFSKTVAKRLRHAHGVSLMLRLIVRNAAPHPETTTVISAAKLVG